MEMLKNKKIIISVIFIVALLIIIPMMFSAKNRPINDPIAMVDLSMNMESDLGLQDVYISEVTGGVLEIRIKSPEYSSMNDFAIKAAYIFGYVEPFVNKETKIIRVIYTVNYLDSKLFEASLSDISDWTSKNIDDATFAKRIKFVNLPVKQ